MASNSKKHKKTKKTNNADPNDSVNRRLDALIRVLLETLYDKKKKLNETTAIRLLNSAGLTPTEIAKILGKKDRSAIAPSLYAKGKSKKKKSKKSTDEESQNKSE